MNEIHMLKPSLRKSKKQTQIQKQKAKQQKQQKQQRQQKQQQSKGPVTNDLYVSFDQPVPHPLVPRHFFSSEFIATYIGFYLNTKSMIKCFKQIIQTDHLLTVQPPTIFSVYHYNLCRDYLMEIRFRAVFRRLLYHWRLRKINKKSQELIDPITFMPITKLVTIYDMKQGRKYCFEATSIIKSITKNLFYQQYTMPQPKPPKNIITNIPFTLAQLTSLYDQLKGQSNAGYFAYYRKLKFQLPTWTLHMHPTLNLEAIKEELRDPKSADGRDIFLDFMKDYMVIAKFPLTEHFETVLDDAVEWFYDDSLLAKFRSICINHYESRLFGVNIHNTLVCAFINLFKPQYPAGPLWTKVTHRQIKETEDLRKAEAMEVDD